MSHVWLVEWPNEMQVYPRNGWKLPSQKSCCQLGIDHASCSIENKKHAWNRPGIISDAILSKKRDEISVWASDQHCIQRTSRLHLLTLRSCTGLWNHTTQDDEIRKHVSSSVHRYFIVVLCSDDHCIPSISFSQYRWSPPITSTNAFKTFSKIHI